MKTYTKLTIEECKTRFNEKVQKGKVKRREVTRCHAAIWGNSMGIISL